MPTIRFGFSDSPSLSGSDALALYGPILGVRIGLDPTFQPNGGSRPNLPPTILPALVDTGAALTCIDSILAMDLKLPVVDREDIAGPQGVSTFNVHVAQIEIPDLKLTVAGRFPGVHLTAGGQRYFALIGRRFLQGFTMTYEGRKGTVTINDD